MAPLISLLLWKAWITMREYLFDISHALFRDDFSALLVYRKLSTRSWTDVILSILTASGTSRPGSHIGLLVEPESLMLFLQRGCWTKVL
jgi:hypothetical protein